MSSTFGRRALPTYAAPPREPAIPVAMQEALIAVKRPQQDPEFVAWTAARAKTRWKIWGMSFLVVLGGPLAYFLPDGLGQIAGIASSGIGLFGMVMRWRDKFKSADNSQKQRSSRSNPADQIDWNIDLDSVPFDGGGHH